MKHRISALIAIATLLMIAVYACAYGALPKGREDLRAPPQAELVLVFCLTEAPDVCQEQRPLLEPVPESACGIGAQLIASAWLADHPKWMLAGWRCEEHAPERSL